MALTAASSCGSRPASLLKDGRIVFDGGINEALKPEMLMNIYDFDVASYLKG